MLALEALHSSVLFLGVCWFYIELNKAMKVEHSHSCSWDGEVAFQPPLGLPICGTNITLRARRCARSDMSLFLLTNVWLTVRTLQSVEKTTVRVEARWFGWVCGWLAALFVPRCTFVVKTATAPRMSSMNYGDASSVRHTLSHTKPSAGAPLSLTHVFLAVCVFDHFLSASSLLLSLLASCDFTKLRTLSLSKASRACNAFIVKAIRGFLSEECGPIESLCLCLYVCLSPLIVSSCTAEFQPLSLASVAAPLPRAPGLSLRLWLKGAFLL